MDAEKEDKHKLLPMLFDKFPFKTSIAWLGLLAYLVLILILVLIFTFG